MDKIPCEMIRDLFPSYIDELTSDTTNRFIEEHIADCEECSQILEAMHTPAAEPAAAVGEKREIDFLKKFKRRNLTIIIGSLSAAVLLVCTVLAARAFVSGDYLYGDWLACKVQVSGTDLVIEGTPVDNIHGVSKVIFKEENGIVTATTKAVLASPLHSGDFHAEFTAKDEIRQIRINDRILWDEGDEISSLASEVYQTRHDYIGDMSANNKTANALSLSSYLGDYRNELKTSSRPYVWKIQLVDDISETDVSDSDMPVNVRSVKESDMTAFGYVLLAMVGNLDEVTYEYTVDGVAFTKTVTTEDATKFFGQNIKDCGASVRLLNALINKAGLNIYAMGSLAPSKDENTMMINVVNLTENEIQSISVTLYNNGVIHNTSLNISNANGSAMKKGDVFSLGFLVSDFDDENFEDDMTNHELMLEFMIETPDGAGHEITEKIRVPSKYGIETTLKIYGSAKEGFRIEV